MRAICRVRSRSDRVNTTSGGDGDRASAPARDYSPTSFGLDIPEQGAVTLLDQVEVRIFSACGIPPGLGGGTTSGQAVSSLYRQLIFGPVQGLAARLAGELEVKLEGVADHVRLRSSRSWNGRRRLRAWSTRPRCRWRMLVRRSTGEWSVSHRRRAL